MPSDAKRGGSWWPFVWTLVAWAAGIVVGIMLGIDIGRSQHSGPVVEWDVRALPDGSGVVVRAPKGGECGR